jgi:hypothetical protein
MEGMLTISVVSFLTFSKESRFIVFSLNHKNMDMVSIFSTEPLSLVQERGMPAVERVVHGHAAEEKMFLCHCFKRMARSALARAIRIAA